MLSNRKTYTFYLHFILCPKWHFPPKLSWTWHFGGNKSCLAFANKILVPSNSQIQPPKFWLWISMLPKLSHCTNLILQSPMPTDRGAGDKMLEKTELLKLSCWCKTLFGTKEYHNSSVRGGRSPGEAITTRMTARKSKQGHKCTVFHSSHRVIGGYL